MADIAVPMPNWQAPLQALQQQNSPVAQGQANLLQQQAQGAHINNLLSALNLGFTKQALTDYSGQVSGAESAPAPSGPAPGSLAAAGATPDDTSASDQGGDTGAPSSAPSVGTMNLVNGGQAGAPPSNGPPLNAAGIIAGLNQRFAVDPTGGPVWQQRMAAASNLSMIQRNPQALASMKTQRDQAVQSQVWRNQTDASTLYDSMAMVASPQTEHPLTMLSRISPEAAAKIERVAAQRGTTPDALARQYAAEVADQVHRFTGRKVTVDQAGVTRDAATGLPVPNVPQAGLSPYALSKVITAAFQPVKTMVGGVQMTMPNWQFNGGADPTHFVLGTLGKLGIYSPANPGANQTVAQVQRAAQQAATRNPGASDVQVEGHPELTKALNDPSFRFQRPTVANGAAYQPDQLAVLKNYAAQRNDLQEEGAESVEAGARALMYLGAANAILQAKNVSVLATGRFAGIAQHLTSFFGTKGASDYITIAKNLSNAALQNLRANTGGTARPTQLEFKVNLKDLNPAPDMPAGALRNLIGEMSRIAQYQVKAGNAVPAYLKVGNDPASYAKWLQHYWPVQSFVTKDVPAAQSSGGAPTGTPSSESAKSMPNAAKLQAYAKVHFGGDVRAAVQFLRSKGYK